MLSHGKRNLSRYTGQIKSFSDAEKLLADRTSMKLGHNTYLDRLTHDSIGVLLHQTYVVVFNRDGSIKLNSGGWQTVTTKDRMNRFSPVSVGAVNWVWCVNLPQGGAQKFVDGMVVTP